MKKPVKTSARAGVGYGYAGVYGSTYHIETQDKYPIGLSLGYIVHPQRGTKRKFSPRPMPFHNEQPLERQMVEAAFSEIVYSYNTAPKHVWVLGNDGWLDNAPGLIQRIVENDRNPSLRICIEAGTNQGQYIWRRNHIQRGKSNFKNRAEFNKAGWDLLEMLHTHFQETGEPGNPVLNALQVPYQFRCKEFASYKPILPVVSS